MYFNIGPSKKDLYKIILLLLCLLFTFRGCVKALNFDNLTDIHLIRVSVQGNRVNSTTTYFDDFDNQYLENYSLTTGTITLPSGDYRLNSDYVYFSIGVFANYSGYEIDVDQIDGDYETQIIDFSANIGIDTNVGYVYCDYNTDSGIAFCPFNSVGATNITRVHVTFDFSKYSSLNHNGLHYGYLYGVDWYFCNSYSKKTKDSTNEIAQNTSDINESINDSSIDDNSASDLTSNSAFQDANGLQAIIQAPLTFIQSLTSTTCSAISLTIPYIDTNVSLPCMSSVYNKALGQQLVNLIALVINGVVLYRYCLKILQIVKDAKNPNKDGLEVLDL